CSLAHSIHRIVANTGPRKNKTDGDAVNTISTARRTTVGPLNDAAGNNYGITGLKYHPFTGIFYGVTRDPTNPDYLVIDNPATALVTPIGPLGAILTDMAINPTTGFMYAVSCVK